MQQMTDGLAQPQRKWAMTVVALGMTMAILDGAIANVALPTIAVDLHVNPASSIWVINAFQLAMTISLLSFSSLGDLFGYHRIYTIGVFMFAVTSLICALSDSFVTLIIARGLQGFSAAAIISVNTALLRMIFPSQLLPRGMGINSLIIAVSAAAGPTLAAGILAIAPWPWLFAINVPIGLLAFGLSLKFLPRAGSKKSDGRFDFQSAAMNAVTFGVLIFVIDGFAHRLDGYLLASGVLLVIVVGWWLVRRQQMMTNPLLPVDLLKSRIFTLSLFASVCSFIAQMLALVAIPFFFQRILGLNQVETGLLLTPWPLGTMISAPLSARLMGRFNAGLLGVVGLSIFGVALFLLGTVSSESSHIDIIWRMFLGGIGFGIFITPNNSTIIASAPKERTGGASGMLGMARLLGQTIGAAMAAIIFSAFPAHGMRYALMIGAGIALLSAAISGLRIRK